jgi:type II secretory pathway pseudopilin PulG
MIAIGILGLATVVAICVWVVFRDREATDTRAARERMRSFEVLASNIRTNGARSAAGGPEREHGSGSVAGTPRDRGMS